jgi:hypothetical protein
LSRFHLAAKVFILVELFLKLLLQNAEETEVAPAQSHGKRSGEYCNPKARQ